jgi:hypothetical protein
LIIAWRAWFACGWVQQVRVRSSRAWLAKFRVVRWFIKANRTSCAIGSAFFAKWNKLFRLNRSNLILIFELQWFKAGWTIQATNLTWTWLVCAKRTRCAFDCCCFVGIKSRFAWVTIAAACMTKFNLFI